MKIMNFMAGVAVGGFCAWAIFALTSMPEVVNFSYYLGGLTCGVLLTGVVVYIFLEKLITLMTPKPYYRRPYNPDQADTPPLFLNEDETVDSKPSELITAEDEDEDDWLTDPDFWKKGRKRG